jgi:hypothetical protein
MTAFLTDLMAFSRRWSEGGELEELAREAARWRSVAGGANGGRCGRSSLDGRGSFVRRFRRETGAFVDVGRGRKRPLRSSPSPGVVGCVPTRPAHCHLLCSLHIA